MKKSLLCSLILFLLVTPTLAAENFDSVVAALKAGQNEAALKICTTMDQAGQGSFGLYYNKGLALENLGRLAEARAAFEQALILKPASLSTRRHILAIKGKLDRNLDSIDVLGTPWWSQSQSEVLVILPFLGLAIMALISRIRGQVLPARTTIGFILVGTATLIVICLNSPARERAIVVDQSASLLVEPKLGSATEGEGKLPAGLMVEVLEQNDHFFKVRLKDGRLGWLRNAQLEQLSLPRRAGTKADQSLAAKL